MAEDQTTHDDTNGNGDSSDSTQAPGSSNFHEPFPAHSPQGAYGTPGAEATGQGQTGYSQAGHGIPASGAPYGQTQAGGYGQYSHSGGDRQEASRMGGEAPSPQPGGSYGGYAGQPQSSQSSPSYGAPGYGPQGPAMGGMYPGMGPGQGQYAKPAGLFPTFFGDASQSVAHAWSTALMWIVTAVVAVHALLQALANATQYVGLGETSFLWSNFLWTLFTQLAWGVVLIIFARLLLEIASSLYLLRSEKDSADGK